MAPWLNLLESREGSCDSKASYLSSDGLSYFRYWTILSSFNFFYYYYLRWFLYPSDLLQFHVTEYSVQFHMVLWDFRQLYLILYGSISFWQFHPFSIVSLIFLSVFVQFQPVIETGSLNLSLRHNILQTPYIYVFLFDHPFFPSFHRTILLEMVLLQMS